MTQRNLTTLKYPLLSLIENNCLAEDSIESLINFSVNKDQYREASKVWNFFEKKRLQLTFLDNDIAGYLIDVEHLRSKAQLLKSSPPESGVILLDNPIYPVFSEIPEYVTDADARNHPINAIIYSWVNSDDYEKFMDYYDPEDPNPPDDRDLLILPFYEDTLTLCASIFDVTSPDEIYGWKYEMAEGRGWYGNILDFVMSYIIFYNYLDDFENPLPGNSKLLHQRTSRMAGTNKIEIIDKK